MSYWHDEDWLERVLIPLCRDRNFLKKMNGILHENDFKPRKGEGMWEAYWVASRAFQHWRDYKEPIGGLLKAEMLDYAREHKKEVGKKGREKLLDLVDRIRHTDSSIAVEAIEKKVLQYKQRREMARAVRDLISLQEKGELNGRKWYEICKKAIESHDKLIGIGNYEEDVDKRIRRREKNRDREFPVLFIDGFDAEFRTFPRGEYGIILAKYNVGKSTSAVHLAKAYAMQGFNVLLYTLEDMLDMVEDRLDSSLSRIPMRRLYDKSSKLRRRLNKALEKIRGRIRIVDGTDGGMTIQRMEEIWENFRNQGFNADVIICDYDEGVVASEEYKGDSGERREMKSIHRGFKSFVARRQLWGWMLAQTTRGKSGVRKMIVTGDDAAIDISKMKICALCLGIGDGPEEMGDDSRYLNVAKHRYDKARKGVPIVGDYKRAIFYDSEKTAEAMEDYRKSRDND